MNDNKTSEEILNDLEQEKADKKTREKENKQLGSVLISIILIIAFIIAIIFYFDSVRNFDYKGVKFETVKMKDLIFYNTKLPVYNSSGEKYTDYNFYLRKDPRKSEVSLNGSIVLKKNMVLNMESDFNCEGDGVISIANLKQLYEFLGTKVIKDENASCDLLGRYMYVVIKEGNETKIVQNGISCYNIYINDCEILDGTEKFMVETFVELNNLSKSN